MYYTLTVRIQRNFVSRCAVLLSWSNLTAKWRDIGGESDQCSVNNCNLCIVCCAVHAIDNDYVYDRSGDGGSDGKQRQTLRENGVTCFVSLVRVVLAMTLLWNRISIISIPMLVIGLRQCNFHAFNEEERIRGGGNSWIPKKASNAFEAFEVVFMELWTWTHCLLLCHKSVIWLQIWVRKISRTAVRRYQA